MVRWVEDWLSREGVVVERRYVRPILDALIEAGFEVAKET